MDTHVRKKKKQMATEIFSVVKWEAPCIVVWSLSSKYMKLKSSSYSFYYCYYFIFFIYIIALLNYHKHFFLVLVQNLLPNVFFFFFLEGTSQCWCNESELV